MKGKNILTGKCSQLSVTCRKHGALNMIWQRRQVIGNNMYLENYSIYYVCIASFMNKMISYKPCTFPQYVTDIDPNN